MILKQHHPRCFAHPSCLPADEPFKLPGAITSSRCWSIAEFHLGKVRAALEDIRARKLYEQIATSGIGLNDAYFKK
jgi:hypothetical protein